MENKTEKSEYPIPKFRTVVFTEMNPIDHYVREGQDYIKIATYRQRIPDGVKRKGVIFYLHGYGAYCEHEACTFKALADQGYECFGMDQRGFGNSEGTRGYLESAEQLYNDYESYFEKVIKSYQIDNERTPLILMGLSFGGLLSFNLAIRNQNMFRAMILIVPFFRAQDQALYKKQWMLKAVNFFHPKYEIPNRKYQNPLYYEKYAFYYEDPKRYRQSRVSTLVLFKNEQDYAIENIPNMKTPYLLLTASQDIMVDNKVAEEVFQKVGNERSKHKNFEEWIHVSMMLEEEHNKQMVQEILEYLHNIIE